jgi:hypothetical protein
MQEINYTRPFLYPYQKAIVDSPARFTVTEAATKVGKSASHLIWLFEQPLALNLTAGQSVWWVAPVYGQAEVMFNRLKNQLSDRGFMKFNETKLTATYPTGAVIHFKSAEKPDNLYGDDVYAAVFDEFTRSREEAWHALRSTLTSTGGKCKFIGNVKGRKNWGHKMAMRAKAGEDPNYAYFKITAYDAAAAGMMTKDGRAFIDEINDAKRDLPENVFKELYLAEASEDGSNPFGLDHIARCVYGLSSLPSVCFGVDLAKGKNPRTGDWTVITGLDRFGQISHFERFQRDWKLTREAILALPPGMVTIDSTGVGDPIAEDIARVRPTIMVTYTAKEKQQLMEGLAYAIQNRQTTVLDGVMKDELDSFEFVYTRTGVTYSAPAGMHDDCVNSLALAKKNHTQAAATGEISVW